MNEEKTDPLEQSAKDDALWDDFQKRLGQRIAWGELRKRLVEREDYRKNVGICRIQGLAAARAIYPRLQELDGIEMNDAQIAQDSEVGKDAWISSAAEILGDAILAENLKHCLEIETALAEMRKWALTGEELAELMQ